MALLNPQNRPAAKVPFTQIPIFSFSLLWVRPEFHFWLSGFCPYFSLLGFTPNTFTCLILSWYLILRRPRITHNECEYYCNTECILNSLTVGGVTEIRRVKDKCNFFSLEFSIWKDEVDITYNGKKWKGVYLGGSSWCEKMQSLMVWNYYWKVKWEC